MFHQVNGVTVMTIEKSVIKLAYEGKWVEISFWLNKVTQEVFYQVTADQGGEDEKTSFTDDLLKAYIEAYYLLGVKI